MKIRILFLLLVLLITTPYLFAQQPMVYECADNPKVKDALMQKAIEKAVADNRAIGFLTESSPCGHTKNIAASLNETVSGKHFNRKIGHLFSLLKNGEDFFSVEQFVFKDHKTAASVAKTLEQRDNNVLKSKSRTRYDFFLLDNNIFFFIADSQIYQSNRSVFVNLKDNLTAEYELGKR